MKISVTIVRTLMGLLLIVASVVVLFKLAPPPELTGNAKIFMDGVNATVYLMPLIKLIELLCGIAFVTSRFMPLAIVLISPIIVNILLFHGFLAPEGLPVAIFLLLANLFLANLFLANLFLAYAYRKNYQPLLAAK